MYQLLIVVTSGGEDNSSHIVEFSVKHEADIAFDNIEKRCRLFDRLDTSYIKAYQFVTKLY
jgi:predicted transglutaminase-like cysteine proteinase